MGGGGDGASLLLQLWACACEPTSRAVTALTPSKKARSFASREIMHAPNHSRFQHEILPSFHCQNGFSASPDTWGAKWSWEVRLGLIGLPARDNISTRTK
jgi:hypothetical protein